MYKKYRNSSPCWPFSFVLWREERDICQSTIDNTFNIGDAYRKYSFSYSTDTLYNIMVPSRVLPFRWI